MIKKDIVWSQNQLDIKPAPNDGNPAHNKGMLR